MYFTYSKLRFFLKISKKTDKPQTLNHLEIKLLELAVEDMGRLDPKEYLELFRKMANYRYYRAIGIIKYEGEEE